MKHNPSKAPAPREAISSLVRQRRRFNVPQCSYWFCLCFWLTGTRRSAAVHPLSLLGAPIFLLPPQLHDTAQRVSMEHVLTPSAWQQQPFHWRPALRQLLGAQPHARRHSPVHSERRRNARRLRAPQRPAHPTCKTQRSGQAETHPCVHASPVGTLTPRAERSSTEHEELEVRDGNVSNRTTLPCRPKACDTHQQVSAHQSRPSHRTFARPQVP